MKNLIAMSSKKESIIPLLLFLKELYLRILKEESDEKRPLVKFVRCQATLENFKTLCPETRSFPWLADDVSI